MSRILLVPLLIAVAVSADVIYKAEEITETAEYLGVDSEGILVKFTLPALLEESRSLPGFSGGTVLRVPWEGSGMPYGAPDLPVIRRMVMVPNTGDIRVEIVSEKTSPLGIYNIPPFQPYPTRSGEVPPFTIDNEIYLNSEFYPSKSVTVDRVSILRDIRVAWINFNPVQYNPVTGETVITTDVTVRLVAEGTGENEFHRASSGITRSYLPFYEDVLGFELGGSDIVDGSYLVIGTTESIFYCNDLIDWKRQKGYQVEIGIVPDIGSTSSEIDSWIENAYNEWPNPPEWLLIVGGENSVPAYYSSSTAADNQYGVIGSGFDPSIHVGRLTGIDDTDCLHYQSWKILNYENDPFQPVDSWFQHAISIGSTDFQDPWMSYRYAVIFMIHAMTTTLYCTNSSYGGIPPTVANISDEINTGLSLLSYIGHGSFTAWGTTGFCNGDVANLSNGRKLPWISSIACLNGQFDAGYCFAEAWMSEGDIGNPKGAVGIMAATTLSPVGPTDSLALYQFRGYFEEEMYHMGSAFDYGKIKAYFYTGHSGNSDMHMIFGCPEFDIFTDTSPLVYLDVSHWENISPGPWSVTVTVTGGSPVEGALVGIVQGDVLLESGYTNASGIADFDIPTIPTSEDVTITCTFHNRYPYVGTAYVATGIENGRTGIVQNFELASPSPNPFAGITTLRYCLASPGIASLDIYDVSGRLVRNLASGEHSAGTHTLSWAGDDADGTPVPGGIYLLRLTSGDDTRTRSCVVIR